jgi:hypothetical protein
MGAPGARYRALWLDAAITDHLVVALREEAQQVEQPSDHGTAMGRRLSPDQRRTINRLLAGRDFDEGQVRLKPRFASLILASTAETLKALLRPRLHGPVNSTLPHS